MGTNTYILEYYCSGELFSAYLYYNMASIKRNLQSTNALSFMYQVFFACVRFFLHFSSPGSTIRRLLITQHLDWSLIGVLPILTKKSKRAEFDELIQSYSSLMRSNQRFREHRKALSLRCPRIIMSRIRCTTKKGQRKTNSSIIGRDTAAASSN